MICIGTILVFVQLICDTYLHGHFLEQMKCTRTKICVRVFFHSHIWVLTNGNVIFDFWQMVEYCV